MKTFIIAALSAALAFLGGVAVASYAESTTPAETYSQSDWAYEVCRHGAQQFYVGRNIPQADTLDLAVIHCDESLKFNGEEKFIEFFAPIPH